MKEFVTVEPLPFFKHNRRIGQNFLVDTNYIDVMLKEASLSKEDVCLEIGPGQGVLTKRLVEKNQVQRVYALEVDKRLEPYLTPLCADHPELALLWEDAVRFDYASLHPSPTKLIANIPYHITTPLLWKLLEDLASRNLKTLFLMVQKEAALRLKASPQTKERYPLGITLDAMGKVDILRTVPPQAFRPPPKVDSAIIRISLEKNVFLPRNTLWRKLLARGFTQRRKTLYNNLKGSLSSKDVWEKLLKLIKMPSSCRAEELSTEQWLALCNGLSEADFF